MAMRSLVGFGEAEKELRAAVESLIGKGENGRWMLAIWSKSEDGVQLNMQRVCCQFPRDEFGHAIQMLQTDLEKCQNESGMVPTGLPQPLPLAQGLKLLDEGEEGDNVE